MTVADVVPVQELHPARGLAVGGLIGLAVFGPVLLLFLVPYLRGVAAGLRTGNWWTPFERRTDGRYSSLAKARQFSLFRAPEPHRRATRGLVARWVFWTVVVVTLGYLPGQFLVMVLGVF